MFPIRFVSVLFFARAYFARLSGLASGHLPKKEIQFVIFPKTILAVPISSALSNM
jgi:hypothetical protein